MPWTFESRNLESSSSAYTYIFRIFMSSSYTKVIGSRSRSLWAKKRVCIAYPLAVVYRSAFDWKAILLKNATTTSQKASPTGFGDVARKKLRAYFSNMDNKSIKLDLRSLIANCRRFGTPQPKKSIFGNSDLNLRTHESENFTSIRLCGAEWVGLLWQVSLIYASRFRRQVRKFFSWCLYDHVILTSFDLKI